MKFSFPLTVAAGVIFAGGVGAAVYFTAVPGQAPKVSRVINQVLAPEPEPEPEPEVIETTPYTNEKLGFSLEVPIAHSFATLERDAVAFSNAAKEPWYYSVDVIGKGIYEYNVPTLTDTEAWLKAETSTDPGENFVPPIDVIEWVEVGPLKFVVYVNYAAVLNEVDERVVTGQVAATTVTNGRRYTITERTTYPGQETVVPPATFMAMVKSFKVLE